MLCYQKLRQAVMDGAYPPGAKLIERNVCSDLGVSRTTLRAALHQLAAEGFIRIRPGEGASVDAVNPAQAQDALEVRGALEGLAARLAARRAKRSQIAELERIHRRIRAALEKGRYLHYLEWTKKFHDAVVQAAGNAYLCSALEAARIKLIRYDTDILLTGHVEELSLGHKRILEAIKAKDPDAAEREARSHVELVQYVVSEIEETRAAKKI